MNRSKTHFRLANIMYLYAINKISLNEQYVCFIICLIRMHKNAYCFLLLFFSYTCTCFNTKRIQIHVMNSTCPRFKCVKKLTAFYVLSKMLDPKHNFYSVVVSALVFSARCLGFDIRRRRGKIWCPNMFCRDDTR